MSSEELFLSSKDERARKVTAAAKNNSPYEAFLVGVNLASLNVGFLSCGR